MALQFNDANAHFEGRHFQGFFKTLVSHAGVYLHRHEWNIFFEKKVNNSSILIFSTKNVFFFS